jgi:preprotein translocase subunit YajC
MQKSDKKVIFIDLSNKQQKEIIKYLKAILEAKQIISSLGLKVKIKNISKKSIFFHQEKK